MSKSMEQLETPALLLDEARMERNIERMREQVRKLGVTFRPHVKTHKCIEVARRMMETPEGPITVSTLKEAEYFAQQGVKDILYAVCISPNKLDHVAALQDRGVFESHEHPVWLLMDRIAHASAGHPLPDDSRHAALLAFCDAVAEEISRATAGDAALFRRGTVRVESFLAWLEEGPPAARVTRVEVEFVAPAGHVQFKVRFD